MFGGLDLKAWLRIAALVFVVLLFPAGYLKGCSDEKGRFDAYKGQVKAAGEAQEQRTLKIIRDDKQAAKEADDAYKAQIDRITDSHAAILAKLRANARRSIVPPVPPAPAGGQGVEQNPAVVCFARDRLSQGLSGVLQRYGERAAASAQRGASAIAAIESCAGWAMKEWENGQRQ